MPSQRMGVLENFRTEHKQKVELEIFFHYSRCLYQPLYAVHCACSACVGSPAGILSLNLSILSLTL